MVLSHLHRHAAVVLAMVAPGIIAACTPASQPPLAAVPPALPTLVVHAESVAGEQIWDGTVEAVDETRLAAQTNARVAALPVDVGARVKRGDVMVRLTDVEQAAAVRRAEAAVAAAQADRGQARKDWQRTRALVPIGAATQAALDQALARRDATQAALDAAEAQLRSARQQLDYTTVRAPFDGIVTRRLVHVGEAVQSGPPAPQPLLAMVSLQALRVDVTVPQSVAQVIRAAREATVIIAHRAPVPATKIIVFPYADPATHSFRVRVALPLGTEGVYPGMSVKVAFATDRTARLLLPESAVWRRGELTGVYVLEHDSVSLRLVRLGRRYAGRREILSGLAAGETVVRDPVAAIAWLSRQQRGDGRG